MTTSRLAVIDLGSNTARLVIYAYEVGLTYKLIDQVRERVRLAEGIDSDGEIHKFPMQRAVETLSMFRHLCDASNVDQIIAVATSATRDAKNQAEFLRLVKKTARINLRVISGEEEAYYGYLGMINTFQYQDCYLFDLGGGSVQLSEVRKRRWRSGFSLPMGAVRMTERFMPDAPPTRKHINTLRAYVASQISEQVAANKMTLNPSLPLIGAGGTARALAKLNQADQPYPIDHLHAYELTRGEIQTLIKQMSRLSREALADMPGMNDERVDVILPGAIVIDELMNVGKFERLIISGAGVREGVFFEQFLGKPNPRPAIQNLGAAPTLKNPRAFAVDNMALQYGQSTAHARHVRKLAVQLFDQLAQTHGYRQWERELLSDAALLHDVGYIVNYYNHDKHSEYLITDAELPGFNHREIAIMALIARYHRKGSPDCEPYCEVLHDDDEERVAWLSAFTRMAEYLDRGRRQVVQAVKIVLTEDELVIETRTKGEASVELYEAQRASKLLAKLVNRTVRVI